MMTAAQLEEILVRMNAYSRALAWERSAVSTKSFWQRFVGRLKTFGPRYLLSAAIHYSTVLFPRLGRIKVRSSTFWGKKVVIELRAAEGFQILFRGAPGSEPELRLTRFLLRKLTPKDVFYDVGANIGYYTMLGAELGAKVHAFEPVSHTFTLLETNVADYGSKVNLNCVALCDKEGEITMYLPPDWYLTSTLLPQTLEHISKAIVVRAMTLDTYVLKEDNPPPTIIKIDVEGAELLVLLGGRSTIETFRPIVIIEVCPGQRGSELSVPAAEFLLKYGYCMHTIDPNGFLVPITASARDVIPDIETEFDNLVFLPKHLEAQ